MSDIHFLDIPDSTADAADILILPLPFEGTVSYGGGTAQGPASILRASGQVEDLDEELEFDLFGVKYFTAPAVEPADGESAAAYLSRVTTAARTLHAHGGLVFGLGGEHSVTPALVRAAIEAGTVSDPSQLTVVQIDAHADLRDQYEDTPWSHACAMRRVLDLGASVIAIGIRSADRAEWQFGRACPRLRTFSAQALTMDPTAEAELLHTLGHLRGDVYLTIDIDGFETSLCPGTGTPQPGGLAWWPTLRLLRRLVMENEDIRLVGCDICEVAPQSGTAVNEFVAARLACKLVAYQRSR